MPAARAARLVRVLMLLATIGPGAALVGCADIHPAPNDPGTGMLASPTDEADQFRRAEERAQDDREEGQERRQ